MNHITVDRLNSVAYYPYLIYNLLKQELIKTFDLKKIFFLWMSFMKLHKERIPERTNRLLNFSKVIAINNK